MIACQGAGSLVLLFDVRGAINASIISLGGWVTCAFI